MGCVCFMVSNQVEELSSHDESDSEQTVMKQISPIVLLCNDRHSLTWCFFQPHSFRFTFLHEVVTERSQCNA